MRKTLCLVSTLAVALLAASGARADRPDDRAGPLGAGGAVATDLGAAPVRPDDRAGPRGAVASSGPSSIRPDDRGGVRPVPISTSTPLVAAVPADGFHWSDAAIGAGFAFAVVLLAGALALTIRQRRRLALS